jgi:site-specific DNA-cytosine methylase
MPTSTIVSNQEKGVPYGVVDLGRELCLMGPRLAARAQGLPDDYNLSMMSMTQAYRAIGNGFPPQVPAYYLGQL